MHLSVSGGYNGDFYAYLSYNGVLIPLLNRVGVGTGSLFGYADSGFSNIALASFGKNVHTYLLAQNPNGGTLNGTWQADGRGLSPLSAPSSFDADGMVTLNGTFLGMDLNGAWTLFFSDLSAGGGQAKLNGWSLEITAIPEPVNPAVVVFVGVVMIISLLRSEWVRKFFRQPSAR